ncbi:hypothetical protein LSH36_40g07025 [Paralvinella palmiformis]|uniref:Uncharacterized protein n=1 Tax=Paralvinella palmiformis TaxID=53620 RepID=A0AAD9K7F6_9ANNE|nr:hypothetical protein LSH36_40g07025 [Paralvinella palmiformis]
MELAEYLGVLERISCDFQPSKHDNNCLPVCTRFYQVSYDRSTTRDGVLKRTFDVLSPFGRVGPLFNARLLYVYSLHSPACFCGVPLVNGLRDKWLIRITMGLLSPPYLITLSYRIPDRVINGVGTNWRWSPIVDLVATNAAAN